MQIDLSQFRETFFQEAAEHLETLESALLSMRAGQSESETRHAIFRCAHSVKAGAATFGFEAVTRFTHVLETLLDGVRNGEIPAGAPLIELLLQSVDVLRSLVDAAARGEAPPPGWEDIIEELDRARGAGKPQSKVDLTSAAYEIQFEPGPEVFSLGLDPLLVLRDLGQLGRLTAQADLSRLPVLSLLDAERCYIGWHLHLETSAGIEQIRDAFAFMEDVATVKIEPVAVNPAGEERVAREEADGPHAATKPDVRATSRGSSIRVATEKVDSLIDLIGELVIANSVAAQLMNGFTPGRLPRLQEAMAEMDRYTRELQERAMRIRMMPLGSILSRFPRLVHDTAQSLGKHVTLEISGEETELDKGMVERITDPLTHLVRNAVDHGIERPDERRLAGKAAGGTIRLTAYHQAGNVIVEVSDDGRGLDTKRIRNKGIERGLLAADEQVTEEQLHALILRPGFSTAETVSDLSGRGVGMDVVKKSVEALNGSLSLESSCGRGSVFRMKLPLTLAIVDGLLLSVGEQTYVMPLISIVESIRPQPGQVRDAAGCGDVVVVRKEPLPLLRLSRLFHLPAGVTDPAEGLVVIVEHEGRRMALLVDELLGQQQVVVKSLETNFRKVEGIAGATILGDGRAALILDVAGIAALSRAA